MNNKYLKKFYLTGPCEVDIDVLVEDWNDDWVIVEHDELYRLAHHDSTAENFTKTDLKCEISAEQALEIIQKLSLVATQNSLFLRGKTWRTTYGER